MARSKKKDTRPVLMAGRRKFLGALGAALAAAGASGDLLASSLMSPGYAVLPQDPEPCTTPTTVTTTGVWKGTGGTKSYTQTVDPPSTGTGTSTYSLTMTLRGSGTPPWSATYTTTASGTYSANGSVSTVTFSTPPTTMTVTWSKTSTTTCVQATTIGCASPRKRQSEALDVDGRRGLGRDCHLS